MTVVTHSFLRVHVEVVNIYVLLYFRLEDNSPSVDRQKQALPILVLLLQKAEIQLLSQGPASKTVGCGGKSQSHMLDVRSFHSLDL